MAAKGIKVVPNSKDRRTIVFPSHDQLLQNEFQHVMRIKVNRVAILQELNVDHVLRNLFVAGVISHADIQRVQQGVAGSDKARLLLDILPNKGKDSDWYKHFRSALKSPETEDMNTRRRYSFLVEFLDNTIIQKPRAPQMGRSGKLSVSPADAKVDDLQLPKYDPLPHIVSPSPPPEDGQEEEEETSATKFRVPRRQDSNTFVVEDKQTGGQEEPPPPPLIKEVTVTVDETAGGMTLVQGYYHKWLPLPDHFTSLLKEPEELLQQLRARGSQDALRQIDQEMAVLKRMRDLELTFAMSRRGQLPAGFLLCFSSSVHEVLSDKPCLHMYLKHFRHLKTRWSIDMLAEITGSFNSILGSLTSAEDKEARELVTRTALLLSDLLKLGGCFPETEAMISLLLRYLETNPVLETWVDTFNALSTLTAVRNANLDFFGANLSIHEAWVLKEKIEMASMGIDVLDCGQLYLEMSRKFREEGSLAPAHSWAKAALQEVEPDNSATIVEALCVASRAYAARFMAKKSITLAVAAVQQARHHFGTHHPAYVEALINYTAVSHEFLQDKTEVDVARCAVELSQLVHGYPETLQHARARRALAAALMGAHRFQGGEFLQQAQEGVRVSADVVASLHPALALASYTLAMALQWQAVEEPSARGQHLMAAELQAKQALKIFRGCFGDVSSKTGQAHALLGQIYTKMEKWKEAGECLERAVQLTELCVPSYSHLLMLARATLGTFCRIREDPRRAAMLLMHAVEAAKTADVYLKWVHLAFENLHSALMSLERVSEAYEVKNNMEVYLKEHPRGDISVSLRDFEKAPEPIRDFLATFDPWIGKKDKIKKGFAAVLKASRDAES